MRTELETLEWIRSLMKPHNFKSCAVKKVGNKHWIAGHTCYCEEFVLINLRQKVLKRIDRVEKELQGVKE